LIAPEPAKNCITLTRSNYSLLAQLFAGQEVGHTQKRDLLRSDISNQRQAMLQFAYAWCVIITGTLDYCGMTFE